MFGASVQGICRDRVGASRPNFVFKPVIFGTPIVTETQSFPSSAGATVRAPWRLSALSICHSKSDLYGAFVWARRALTVVTGGLTGGLTGGDRYPGGRHVPLLNSPWSSPKKIRFRKFWRSYLDQNLLRITNPVSDLTKDQ